MAKSKSSSTAAAPLSTAAAPLFITRPQLDALIEFFGTMVKDAIDIEHSEGKGTGMAWFQTTMDIAVVQAVSRKLSVRR